MIKPANCTVSGKKRDAAFFQPLIFTFFSWLHKDRREEERREERRGEEIRRKIKHT